jgi:hypothetical protein
MGTTYNSSLNVVDAGGAVNAATDQDREWDRLAHALNQYGIRHLAPLGGGAAPAQADPETLFRELAKSPDARLQEAAIPLLLTYPQFATSAQAAITGLNGALRDRAIRRYVAACALQRMWRTRLELALGPHPLIPVPYLAELGLPGLDEDYGRAALRALADQESARYGYDAWAGYTSLMDLILSEVDLRRWGRPTGGAMPPAARTRRP